MAEKDPTRLSILLSLDKDDPTNIHTAIDNQLDVALNLRSRSQIKLGYGKTEAFAKFKDLMD
jgi:hypothetical protein